MRRLICLLPALLFSPDLAAKDYYVSAIRGNDSWAGTFQAPFKTLTRATSLAKASDRILVLAGRYSPTLGEKFPITVPAGVDLIGKDPRTCIIDAEYDPTRTNNPYTGSPLVRILDKSRFAYVSVVNAPRDPVNNSIWWNTAVYVEGQTGNSSDVEIDHVILDEFARGIMCGGPAGDHDMKNVKIHDCVIQRFYVEGINSWVNKGTATGNQIWNCTIAGHKRPASPFKPYPRALMSFNVGAQFDVRNCVLYMGDHAGIEASTPSTITSDHNCLHSSWGGFAPFRGPTQGPKDLLVDPQLAAGATTKARVDPHQTGTFSPLWRKGTNFPGQDKAFDIDYKGRRLVAATVDIGADEYDGPDAYFVGIPKIGTTVRIGYLGTASNQMLLVVGFKALTTGVKVPGLQGELWIDPSLPIVISVAPKNAKGYGSLPFPIPNATGLLRLEIDLQGIDLPALAFTDLDQINLVN